MSLTINHNLMAMNAAREPGSSFASLADPGLSTANGLGVREIIRAEIKPLNSADAQTPATALETGTASAAQGASTGASGTQASPVAPEQQTGSILNTTDLGGSVRERLSSLQGGSLLQGGNFHLPDTSLPDVSAKLREMGLSNDLQSPGVNDPGLDLEKHAGVMMRHGQDMLNATAHNAEMVNNLIRGIG